MEDLWQLKREPTLRTIVHQPAVTENVASKKHLMWFHILAAIDLKRFVYLLPFTIKDKFKVDEVDLRLAFARRSLQLTRVV